MEEVRLIDANALKRNMEFVCMGIMSGTEPYNAPLTEIDNAPTVEPNNEYSAIQYSNGFNDGFTLAKDTIIQNIAKQYIDHNELVPIWLSIGDIRGEEK